MTEESPSTASFVKPEKRDVVSRAQEFALRSGRVPAPRRRNVKRVELLQRLNREVQRLVDDEKKWLVVYGMCGCGKTQLIVDLLWQRPELALAHFQHIIWITDRNMLPERLVDVATNALAILFHSFREGKVINGIGEDQLDSTYLASDVAVKLRAELDELAVRGRRVLFIVDGVELAETVEFLESCRPNRNCYFIATTTLLDAFSTLDDDASAAFFRVPSYADDLDTTAWRAMARNFQCISSAVDDRQLDALVAASGRSMALMEKVLGFLRDDPQAVASLLFRIRHRPLSELSRTGAYQHADMDVAIRRSLEQLGDRRLCESFEKSACFEPGFWVNIRLFRLVWPLDLCGRETDSEQIGMIAQDLRRVVRHSLLDDNDDRNSWSCDDDDTKAKIQKALDENAYRIHPVIHSHLIHNGSVSFDDDNREMYGQRGAATDRYRANIAAFLNHLLNAVEETRRRRVRVEYAAPVALFRQYYVDNFERLHSALDWADALTEQRRRKVAIQKLSSSSSGRSITSSVNPKECESRVDKQYSWSLRNSLIVVMRWLWQTVFGYLRFLEEPTRMYDEFNRKSRSEEEDLFLQ